MSTTPQKVQEEIANINDDSLCKAINPQAGELKVMDKKSDLKPNSTTITDVANDGFAIITTTPSDVPEGIANINDGDPNKEVILLPDGTLVVKERKDGKRDPFSIPVTDVAREGFGSAPIVYAYEEEVIAFLNNGGEPFKRGLAYEWKGEDVYHVHIEVPKTSTPNYPYMAFFYVSNHYRGAGITSELAKYLENHSFQKAIVCWFNVQESGTIMKGAFIASPSSIGCYMTECDFKYVPQKSELYSRSKGLLEVDVLGKKTAAIIGLGSFGSNIAIELAKAGVGNFKLFDFDRVELSNIARHTCGINDLGRYKTHAIRDAILQKNPFANVSTFEININEQDNLLISEIKDVDIILCMTDENQSRSRLNSISVEHKKKIIYGRAITRAEGGDVFRYVPNENKPCLACLIGKGLFNFQQEEISSERQADRDLPAYTSEEDRASAIQVGLSSDILPICNMIVKLTLVELSKGLNSGLLNLEEDLIADYYIWANRRENKYKNLPKMEYKANQLSILRWYGVRVPKDESCITCNLNIIYGRSGI